MSIEWEWMCLQNAPGYPRFYRSLIKDRAGTVNNFIAPPAPDESVEKLSGMISTQEALLLFLHKWHRYKTTLFFSENSLVSRTVPIIGQLKGRGELRRRSSVATTYLVLTMHILDRVLVVARLCRFAAFWFSIHDSFSTETAGVRAFPRHWPTVELHRTQPILNSNWSVVWTPQKSNGPVSSWRSYFLHPCSEISVPHSRRSFPFLNNSYGSLGWIRGIFYTRSFTHLERCCTFLIHSTFVCLWRTSSDCLRGLLLS